ncbi:MAG: hypothetical protein F2799_03805 [Actinobacteria bacterium]|uniref:Unannotated protein n=1 Tax=freshwater metagenome TaxID=449393 RepID=A0A6J7DL07_9ZZZZ|nr:hypothetical protein [Actinomycetota bacterium]
MIKLKRLIGTVVLMSVLGALIAQPALASRTHVRILSVRTFTSHGGPVQKFDQVLIRICGYGNVKSARVTYRATSYILDTWPYFEPPDPWGHKKGYCWSNVANLSSPWNYSSYFASDLVPHRLWNHRRTVCVRAKTRGSEWSDLACLRYRG